MWFFGQSVAHFHELWEFGLYTQYPLDHEFVYLNHVHDRIHMNICTRMTIVNKLRYQVSIYVPKLTQ